MVWPKSSLPVDKAAKALEIANSETLRNEIISMVPPEDALEVAERLNDPELRDALVRRSLAP